MSSANSHSAPIEVIGESLLDTLSLARTTRKTFERLAPFCEIRVSSNSDSSSDHASDNQLQPQPVVSKITSKTYGYIRAIDGSILSVLLALRLATIMVDLKLATRMLDMSPKIGRGVVEGKTEDLRVLASQGLQHARKTQDVLRNASQDVYKIAAATKSNTSIISVSPDIGYPSTLRKSLKEVGSDLVANLGLISQFISGISQLEAWWVGVGEELGVGVGVGSGVHDFSTEPSRRQLGYWEQARNDFQAYSDSINILHSRYPQLLPLSVDYRQSQAQNVSISKSATSTVSRSTSRVSSVSVYSISSSDSHTMAHASVIIAPSPTVLDNQESPTGFGGFIRYRGKKKGTASEKSNLEAARPTTKEGGSGSQDDNKHDGRKPGFVGILIHGVRILSCHGCMVF